MVEPHAFTIYLLCHLRNSLRPVIPDNAWILRMTAAAGTELADPYSYATVIIVTYKSSLQPEGIYPARGVPNTCKTNAIGELAPHESGARVRNAYATYLNQGDSLSKERLTPHNITGWHHSVIKYL